MGFWESFRTGAIRSAALAALGGSSSLVVLGFWGPSVDRFYQQAYLFGALALVVAVAVMILGARRLKSAPASLSAIAGVLVATLLVLIPGGAIFVVLPRLSTWLWLASFAVGLTVASLLFPRNRRKLIPLLWLGCAVVVRLSVTVQRVLTDVGANAAEGIGILAVQVVVWFAVLVAAAIIAAVVRKRGGDEGSLADATSAPCLTSGSS